MPTTRRDDPAESLRLALIGLDAQIAELQETRAQLAALIDQRSAGPAAETAAPQKRRKLSAEARAKISAAAKARWARERQAKAQKPKKTAKKTQSKTKPTKAKPAPAKAKKAPVKKTEPKPSTPAAET
jgi:outer membrane biosynthesis protein TonB